MSKWLPSSRDYSEKRLFCLDLLRGLDMFYLAVVSTVLYPVFIALGMEVGEDGGTMGKVGMFFCQHPWEGFTLYDLIMPLFIFMSGAAVPFAMRSRLDGEGRPTAAFHRHVWARVALLWVLGMLAQGSLHTLDPMKITPYSNTLQSIAVGYVVTAYVLLIRPWAVKIAIPVVLTLAYGLIVHFGGDYTKAGNVAGRFEVAALNAILPAGNEPVGYVVRYGYAFILASLVYPVIALCGAFSTLILRLKSRTEWQRAGALAAFGVGMLAVGWLLAFAGVKMVKHIFTVSFTLQAIGWSVLLLAALYVYADIWKVRRGTGLFLLFGQYALTAYLCESTFRGVCYQAGERVLGGLTRFVPPAWGDVVTAVLFSCVVVFVLIIRGSCKTLFSWGGEDASPT